MEHTSIPERLASWARERPDALAVYSAGAQLTYRDLDRRANRLAHRLLGLGVRPGDPVAVLMERSADLVVTTLAVLKAGGCYLPLHNAYPADRLRWILKGSGTPPLLTDAAMWERAREVHADPVLVTGSAYDERWPDSPPAVRTGPDHTAYVMYTSGSTGHPKGVSVTHRGVLSLVRDRCWDTGWHDRVLMVAPYAFSVSTYELWVPLLRGGQVVLAPPGDLEITRLRQLVRDHAVTGLHLTAGLFRVVAEEAPESLATVREVLTGGDVISPPAVRRVLAACPDTVVRAMYGATETTLFTLTRVMRAPDDPGRNVLVGRPMDDVRAHVLDDRLRPVPPGETGELHIGGDRLARGYLGRDDLTAERYVNDPATGAEERLYRTGDLARHAANGSIELLGRADRQVKIRGFRVEPAEVEAALADHPGITGAAVVAHEAKPGDTRLACYVVAASGAVDTESLRAHVRGALPDYMMPDWFVVVDALPLTPNGKLDRAALPAPQRQVAGSSGAPRTRRQEVLCEIFADVLGVPAVGIYDDFFELGGQSLSATRLINRVETALGGQLAIRDLFECSTVACLDALIGERTNDRKGVA